MPRFYRRLSSGFAAALDHRKTRQAMTNDEYNGCLDTLRWTPQIVSDLTGAGLRQVRRWGTTAPVPDRVADWLSQLTTLANNPPGPPPRPDATAD